jgi:DNA-binding XRE family transcriptional regulator
MTRRHVRWEHTGSDEHAIAYEQARAALRLGQMVYDRRTELGLTQAELAERAGMTQPQLSRLESGGATPTVPLLARLPRRSRQTWTSASAHTRRWPLSRRAVRRGGGCRAGWR